MANKFLSFGEGIEFVLKAISIDSEQRQIYHEDAQIIENEFINAISKHDKTFRKAFKGLALTGSTLDKIKIELPDEFTMLTKTELPCIVEPVVFEKHPSFVALCLSGPDVPENLVELHNGEKFLSRLKLHNWYCENIKDVIPELDNIQCGKNAYKLEYTGHGYAVAHTLVATCIGNSKRQIYFDFVPAFEFDASAWHNGMKKARNNNNGSWFAVPRKFTKPGAADDPLSFMVCAPYWERMVLQDKQNLNYSLRLMKAMRNANGMDRLISYMIKSIFMNRVNTDDEMYNWNKSPGNILISVTKSMQKCLTRGFLPFYLVPDYNVFDTLCESEQDNYKRMFGRLRRRLQKCHKKDCLSPKDMEFLFGRSY